MQSYSTFPLLLTLCHILSKRLISWLFFILFNKKNTIF
nr:MAG TPA: hypothetical protein [Bacteriophage sp.]DAI82118.1 MAG TPA: hypothetical protein [Caudoviricetes sp.]DAS17788.1 MAG TPA: hypothetical protein [Caudoviricetes sp.]